MKYRKKIKVLFIVTFCGGGKTFNDQLKSAIKKIPYIEPIYLTIAGKDWQKYKISKFQDKILELEPPFKTRAKYNETIKQDYDCLFIQCFEFIAAFKDIIAKKPAILACDSTNILAYKLRWQQLKYNFFYIFVILKRLLLQNPPCKRAIKHINVFMSRSECCASSLINDYRIDPKKIIIASGGLDLNVWKPKKKNNKKTVLLFVGNDFNRKGGYFLLELYSKYFFDKTELYIVSNDKRLDKIKLPKGVRWIKDVHYEDKNKLIEIYQSADLFIFPTRNEKLGLANLEAAATGLPIIATDVGGVSEIVKNNYNGYLMPYSSSLEEWAKKINELLDDPDKMTTFSENSRKLAKMNFSEEVLREKLIQAFDQLKINN